MDITAELAHLGSFHNHSSNLPHLNSWIDDLIKLTNSQTITKKKSGALDLPTSDTLVQGLQRYDAIFKELLKQLSIFSEPLTKMYAKTWHGVFKLFDYMVKSYHRYVRHSTDLQKQAQSIILEEQRVEAANKIKGEESVLERTHLRARIRLLEAELEALKMSKHGIERENEQMRKLIEV